MFHIADEEGGDDDGDGDASSEAGGDEDGGRNGDGEVSEEPPYVPAYRTTTRYGTFKQVKLRGLDKIDLETLVASLVGTATKIFCTQA